MLTSSIMPILQVQKKAFKSMVMVLKKEDMQLIRDSFDLSSPQGLQDKVFIDVMIDFCNRGRENLRAMTADHFEEHVRSDGLTFITLKDMLTKNKREDADEACQWGFMVELPGNSRCPVAAFRKYKEKLNPICSSFWQRPKLCVADDADTP